MVRDATFGGPHHEGFGALPTISSNGHLGSAYAHCATAVRADDLDLWFASLFWPEAARAYTHALIAFSVEIAKVRDLVSEPMPGEIRHQWWRDAIETGAPAGNPLAIALMDTISRFNLDKARFVALIDAHGFDLYDDPMPSEDALEGYACDTAGTLFDAIARVLTPGRLPPPCVEAAGRAYALTNVLRALPYQVMKGQLFIPLDLLDRFQLPPEHVLAHRNSPALGLVLNALRARVRGHLREMHAGLGDAGPVAAACLPAFLCEPYLKRMEAPGLDPFKTAIELARWRRQWALWRAARRL